MSCWRWSIFLVVAVMTSALAGRVREQARIAAERMRATRRLYEFTRRLSGLATRRRRSPRGPRARSTPAWAGRPWCCSTQDGDLALRGRLAAGGRARYRRHDARRAGPSRHDEPAGADTATLPIVPWLFLPLRTPRGRVGVVGVGQAERRASRSIPKRAPCSIRSPSRPRPRWSARSLARDMVSGAHRGRDRAGAQHAAGVDLARFPHAAVLDPGIGDQPARLRRQARCGGAAATCSARSSRRPRASTRWCATCSPSRASMPARWSCGGTGSTCARSWTAWSTRRAGAAPRRRSKCDLPADLPLVRADADAGRTGDRQRRRQRRRAHARRTRSVIDRCRGRRRQRRAAHHRRRPGHSRRRAAAHLREIRRARDASSAADEAAKAPASGLPSPRASWRRMAARSPRESPVDDGRGTRIVLTFPRAEAPA